VPLESSFEHGNFGKFFNNLVITGFSRVQLHGVSKITINHTKTGVEATAETPSASNTLLLQTIDNVQSSNGITDQSLSRSYEESLCTSN
jgi:hypothetical protein